MKFLPLQAILFSAGIGTRLKPWTDRHPKALAEVNGKVLLERNIQYLQKNGVSDIIINVHHFAEQIINFLKKKNNFNTNIYISDETSALLDTGGGLYHAKSIFKKNQPILAYNVAVSYTHLTLPTNREV